MTRNSGYIRSHKLLKVANTERALAEGLCHEKAAGVPKSLEDLGLLFDVLTIDGAGKGEVLHVCSRRIRSLFAQLAKYRSPS
jgi:hypothetical protein